ncbi:MAG: hypothetical protein AAF394_17070 [Planctomycetota bacterium]
MSENPTPNEAAECSVVLALEPLVRRRLAVQFLIVSVVSALIYALVDEYLLGKQIAGVPTLFTSVGLSLIAAVLTRDRILAPLCSFGGIISGCLVAAVVSGTRYAQLSFALPFALVLSIPGILTVFLSHWLKKRKLERELRNRQD